MPEVDVTEEELELLKLWREQQKDDRRKRLQYGPSLDQPVRTGSEKMTLGDTIVDPYRIEAQTDLAETAKRLGVELPWLRPNPQTVRIRRSRLEETEVICLFHGTEDMREYLRKGKVYVRCYVCKREHQRRYNGEYRRKMKYKIRPCPRCGDAGFFTGPYCKPCHAEYERERRQRNG